MDSAAHVGRHARVSITIDSIIDTLRRRAAHQHLSRLSQFSSRLIPRWTRLSLARLGLRALPFPISDGELGVQGRTAPPVSCSPAPVPFGLRLRQVS